jgi:P27 family predicted phage terminase small subunit
MPAGRLPLPTAKKKLQGTNKKCRENKNEPKYDSLKKGTPSPNYFNKYSKELWKNLLTEWDKNPIAEVTDYFALEMLCFNFGFWKDTAEKLSKNPDLLENESHGGLSATVQQMNKCFSNCEKLMSRFGLTPSDRARLGLIKKEDIDPDDEKMKELIK